MEELQKRREELESKLENLDSEKLAELETQEKK